MAELAHILDRFVLHFVMSTGVLLLAMVGFIYLQRRVLWFPTLHGWWSYVVPALLSFAIISLREVFDVYYGQLVAKAVTDWCSWVLGLGVAVWGMYRLTPALNAIRLEIVTGRRFEK